jgi:hypothetical protein
MRHTCARVVAIVAFLGLLVSQVAAAPIQAKYKGLTSGEWLAVWWQGVMTSTTGVINGGAFGDNRTVFLSAPIVPAGSPTVTIPVTIPAGTHLLVPIITVECSVAEGPPFHGDDETGLRSCANSLLDLATDPYAEIDGSPVKNPGVYRVESPLFRWGPLPAGNFLELPAGTQSDAVAAGYVLVLQPFSVGVHQITVRANVPDVGIAVDTEFIVTVEPSGTR